MKYLISHISVICLTLMCCKSVISQQLNPDLISVTNSYTFKGDSDLDINNVILKSTFYKKTLQGGKAFLRLGLNNNFSGVDYEKNVISLNPNYINDLQRFHTFGMSLFYLKVINQQWNVGGVLQPQLSSNFTSDLSINDFNPRVLAFINYIKNPKNRFNFGLSFVPNNGLGFPVIPFGSYWSMIGNKTQLNIGFPKTSITYNTSANTSFNAMVRFDNFNYNLSNNMRLNQQLLERINYNEVVASLGVNQSLTNDLKFNLNVGYSLLRSFEFRNENSTETLSELDVKNNFNILFGFQFKPKKKPSKS